jgi:hypothetical protein
LVLNCSINSVSQISLPQLRTLNLHHINTTCEEIELIFQAVSSTIKHLIIWDVKIKKNAVPNVTFTALKRFELENRQMNKFYERLLESIGGSVETLKKLKFNSVPENFNISQFKNLEYLHCRILDKNVNLLKLITIIG